MAHAPVRARNMLLDFLWSNMDDAICHRFRSCQTISSDYWARFGCLSCSLCFFILNFVYWSWSRQRHFRLYMSLCFISQSCKLRLLVSYIVTIVCSMRLITYVLWSNQNIARHFVYFIGISAAFCDNHPVRMGVTVLLFFGVFQSRLASEDIALGIDWIATTILASTLDLQSEMVGAGSSRSPADTGGTFFAGCVRAIPSCPILCLGDVCDTELGNLFYFFLAGQQPLLLVRNTSGTFAYSYNTQQGWCCATIIVKLQLFGFFYLHTQLFCKNRSVHSGLFKNYNFQIHF